MIYLIILNSINFKILQIFNKFLQFRYYIEAVASKQGGGLKFDLNVKMFTSTLNGKVSYMVKTEVQEVEISSVIVPESTVRKLYTIYIIIFLF